MNSKTYIKVLLASFLIGIGISVVGCGSSDKGSSPVPPVGNTAAQVVVNGQTPNNCTTGFITTALDGTSVCQAMIQDERIGTPGDVFNPVRLTPSTPASQQAPGLHIYGTRRVVVQPNDKLTLKSVDGGWGSVVEEGGYLNRRLRCDKVANMMGRRSDGNEVRNEGVPSGLFLTNGYAAYPAFGPGVIYFNEAGPLHFGFNTPVGEGNCFSLKLRFKLERCLDIASLPHKCK